MLSRAGEDATVCTKEEQKEDEYNKDDDDGETLSCRHELSKDRAGRAGIVAQVEAAEGNAIAGGNVAGSDRRGGQLEGYQRARDRRQQSLKYTATGAAAAAHQICQNDASIRGLFAHGRAALAHVPAHF